MNFREIYSVDGWSIRQLRCTDFSAIGQDLTPELGRIYPEVPYGTVIIDKIYLPEIDIFLKQISDYWELHGKKYDRKREELRSKLPKRHNFWDFVTKIIQRDSGLTVVEFDGAKVRQHVDLEIVQGVNDIAYPFIEKKIVGVEKLISPHERQYILGHERVEREKMADGKTYRQAHHQFANKSEQAARRRDPILPGCYPGDKRFKFCKSWEEFKEKFELERV